MQFKDYYKILGVEPTAELKDIKTAYRKLARKYHPDVSDHHEAEDRFKEVAEAYEVLRNKERRAEYDEIRHYGQHGQSFQPPPGWQPFSGRDDAGFSPGDDEFSDFFSSLFGGRGAGSRAGQGGFHMRGQDIETDLPIFLEDTLSAESKSISYQLGGTQKTLKVKIPAGVTEGERIRLKGQGAPGLGEAPAGDLYLRIRLVPHPLFDVEGHNLIITLPLAPWEAALGTKVEVPTLTGKIQLTIPPNSQAGQRLRIKSRGLVSKTGQGDLYAVLKVVMPEACNSETKRIWEQLSQQAHFDPRADWRSAS